MTDRPHRILRRRDVLARCAIPVSTMYAHIVGGAFPRPIKLSERRVGWLEHEIDRWIADRVAARDAASNSTNEAA